MPTRDVGRDEQCWASESLLLLGLRGKDDGEAEERPHCEYFFRRRTTVTPSIIQVFNPFRYIFNVPYGVGKQALDRLSEDMALELKDKNVTVVSLWPAAVKTEISTKSYETTGKVMGSEDLASNFNEGESTEYAGKAVVALASDPKVINKTGKILLTADMGTEYGYKDIDGEARFPFVLTLKHFPCVIQISFRQRPNEYQMPSDGVTSSRLEENLSIYPQIH